MRPLDITHFEAVDATRVDGSKNPLLKRHMEDFQFIRAFKQKNWLVFWIWKVMSDCGRSLVLWLLWSMGFAGLFAWVYSRHLDWFLQHSKLDRFDVLYFSVVTFTTLGFGDVTPSYDNPTEQAWVMAEVVVGYVMLGGLISILANKLSRRA